MAGCGAAHAQVNRDIEHARAFGKIHAQEKDVAPAAVGQVHAHGRGLAQDGVERLGGAALQQLATDAQRIVGGMAGAEHPLIAAHGAHAAAHLVGQRLEPQRAIAGGQGAGDGGARSGGGLRREKDVDGLLESPLQQMGVAGERDGGADRSGGMARHMKAMDGIEEEQGAYPLVEVIARAAEAVERRALGQQFIERGAAADGIERAVAFVGIGGGDNPGQPAHRPLSCAADISRVASSSSTCASTSARSRPASASASWALSRP